MENLNKNKINKAILEDYIALFGGNPPEIKIRDFDAYSHDSIDYFTGSSF